ncbi:glycosaminoglycan xylosylkinase-like [Physella acuta]|uniref:glycosaminoglycan xylosylkinase-like n=1 Tax=Physella acuta TaxID=109671 RepID=UPI0027DDEC99|nr:glycosaminoglycan xylosylkinase-like [Physella acuta]XP_059171967.1 glycosaminoglycan xylosylkinase-like [Physella acuta]XP_059171969.1 glycosaminoglycan xylosylkinase-like [Physella acuta]
MKTKFRLLFVGAAVFVIYVSYKILEPELYRLKNARGLGVDAGYNQYGNGLDKDYHRGEFPIEVLPPNGRQESVVMNAVNQDSAQQNISVTQVIKSLIDRYTPQYTYQLSDSPWKVAAKWVEARQILPVDDQELGAILNAMGQGKVTSADVGHKGTQLKLTLVLNNEQKVIFKPAWYTRDYLVTGTPYAGRDRHNAEIAAFHLGRILELRRTPLAVGRRLDIKNDIQSVATEGLLSTFFNKDGESCFYGRCLYCKGPDDGVCATNGYIEGTLVLWLPSQFRMKVHKHPWSRTYRDSLQAKWETDKDYCQKLVQVNPTFSSGPRLMDIIDTAVFDYLIGNADRHHYETFEAMADSMLIMLDNGKSFGNPGVDELTILAPLYQCCKIRSSLWQRLLALQDGILSKVLEGVLSHDPIAPVLTRQHLEALDRRLVTVLEQIQLCLDKFGISAVVTDSFDKGR